MRYCIPPSKGVRYSAALFGLNGVLRGCGRGVGGLIVVLRPGGAALFVSRAYKRTQ